MHKSLIKIVFFICNPYALFLFRVIKGELLEVFSSYMLDNGSNLFFFCLNVKYKTNLLTTFIKDLLKKLTDLKIQKVSEDRFSREKIKIPFKEKVSGCLEMIIWE